MTSSPPSPRAVPARPSPGPRHRRTALAGLLCAVLGGALAGCGSDPDAGTNGVGRLPAATMQAKARAAARSASTVRLTGDLVSQGRGYTLDMSLAAGGARGTVHSSAASASTFQLLRIGAALYVKADAGFWAENGGRPTASSRAAAARLDGKYVKVPATDPAYRRFSGFTDKDVLLDSLLTLHGHLTAGDRSTVAGVRTVGVSGDRGDGGALQISLEGKPYPLRLRRAGGAGEVRLARWGRHVDLRAPEDDQVVDYGSRVGTGR